MHRESRSALAAFILTPLALAAPWLMLWGFFEIAFLNIPLGALLLLAASVIDATSEQALHKSQAFTWNRVGKRLLRNAAFGLAGTLIASWHSLVVLSK